MKTLHQTIVFPFAFLLFSMVCLSCNPSNSKNPNRSIGTRKINSLELEKVIHHYQESSNNQAKLKAAYFLIENLDGKYSINHASYLPYRDTILKYGDTPVLLEQKLKAMKGNNHLSYNYDIDHIKADYLIKNIDLAFEVYDRSTWKNEIDFKIFCEYILPYRVESEVLEDWRKQILSEKDILVPDGLKMRDAAKLFIRMLSENKKNFVLRWGKNNTNPPDLTYNTLKHLSVGSCKELNDYTLFYLRALGIPCAIDFAPQYANYNVGHSWSSIVVNENKCLPFVIPVKDTLGDYKASHFRLAKVYRKVYSKQNYEVAAKIAGIEGAPSFLKNPWIADVTNQYTQTVDLTIDVPNKSFGGSSVSFLSLFYRFKWRPIAVGERKWGKAHFKNVGVASVYLPSSYTKGKMSVDGYPFYLDSKKSMVELKPDKDSLITVNVLRKFPLQTHIVEYINRMIGGVF